VLQLDEARWLVDACTRGSFRERRNRLIILILYGCGLRTGEVRGLNIQDVDRENTELVVLKGKGDRERSVPVPAVVWSELMEYLLDRKGKSGPLFRTEFRRKRISLKEIGNIVSFAASNAGIEGDVTPKVLRHTFATHLMDKGVDLAIVAILMGHRSPRETGVYLHALNGRREEAVDKLKIMKGY